MNDFQLRVIRCETAITPFGGVIKVPILQCRTLRNGIHYAWNEWENVPIVVLPEEEYNVYKERMKETPQ